MCASSAARSSRAASTTSKGCSSASAMRSTRSGPSASCWIRWRRCSPGLGDGPVLRAELRRLFQWLKDRGVTAVITAERGTEGQLTRHGLEEYVSDCVIALDNRVEEQITTRRLRVMKYRGSAHGTNEYPFLIDQGGISVLPVTSAGLSHSISDEVVSSGIAGIDAMLGIGGFYRGSSVLLSGPSGTGKTTFGSHFVNAACVAGRAGDLLLVRGVARTDRAQHALGRPGPGAPTSRAACCASNRPGPACSGSRCTWC